MAVKPVPDGFTTVTAHMIIANAAEALEFYKKAFGAEVFMCMPMPDGKVMHAEMKIGNAIIMVGEECAEYGCMGPKALGGSAVTLHLYVPDCDAAFKRAVDAGCTVKMPLTDMFWGDRFGGVVDPYGHSWSIATHKEDVPPEDMERRAAEAMAQMAAGGCGEGCGCE